MLAHRSVACCLDKPFPPLLATPAVSCTVSDVLVRRESGGMVRPPIEVRVAIIGNVDRSVCVLIMAEAKGGVVQEAKGQEVGDCSLLSSGRQGVGLEGRKQVCERPGCRRRTVCGLHFVL